MNRVLALARSTPVRAGFLLLAVVSAVAVVVAQRDAVAQALGAVGWVGVGAALVTGVCYVLATALSWRVLLADFGSALPLRPALRIFFVSQVAKYLPGGVWNVLAAAELGADHAIPRRRSATVMAVSLLVSVVTGAMLAVVGLLAGPEARRFAWVAVAIPLGLVLLAPPVLGRVADGALLLLRREPLEKRPTWRGLGAALAWQLLAWGLAGAQIFVLAAPVGLPATVAGWAAATGGYALAWTAGFLALVVPAGAGVREVVLAATLGGSLVTGGTVTVVLLSRVVLTLADLALGLGAAALGRRRSEARP